jgi:hypothetical protein
VIRIGFEDIAYDDVDGDDGFDGSDGSDGIDGIDGSDDATYSLFGPMSSFFGGAPQPQRMLFTPQIGMPGEEMSLHAAGHDSYAVPHYLDSRLCQCLPLVEDGHYATGITVYCDEDRLQGIDIHWKTSNPRRVGNCSGHPFYFHLQAGEYLTSISTCSPSYPDNSEGPFPYVRWPDFSFPFFLPSKFSGSDLTEV